MKTKSLVKAPIGSVAVVVEKGLVGYQTYDEFNQDNRDQFIKVDNSIEELRVTNVTQHETIIAQGNEIKALKEELDKLRKVFEDTLKGWLTK